MGLCLRVVDRASLGKSPVAMELGTAPWYRPPSPGTRTHGATACPGSQPWSCLGPVPSPAGWTAQSQLWLWASLRPPCFLWATIFTESSSRAFCLHQVPSSPHRLPTVLTYRVPCWGLG
jgi:hypothetical protein